MDTKLPTASKFKSNVELYRWVRDSFHKILYELGDVLRNGNLTRPLIQLVVIERTHRSGCPTEQPWCGTGSIRFFQATLSYAVCEACMDGTRTSGGRISAGGMTGRSSIELPSTCHLRSTTCKVLCMVSATRKNHWKTYQRIPLGPSSCRCDIQPRSRHQ